MHTRITRTLIALAGSAALLLTAAPSQAAGMSDEPVPITTPATPIVVTGNGYGHGHGMSQWGAKGAAEAPVPLRYQQILGFYYPGTSLTALSTGLTVLITGDIDNNLTVFPERGLRVRDLGNGRTYKLRTRHHAPRVWRLVRLHGHTKVFYKTSRWHLYKTGGRRSLAGDGEFRSAVGTVTLKLPTGPRTYRGSLRYTNRDTVNVLDLEQYLRGVIAAEMPSSWPAAALQAQAVAARTYAARERADHLDRYYQICDTTACQVYGGVKSETAATDAAAAATAGQVLTVGGQYAFAQFSSSNGGWASAGSQPYLTNHDDPYDRSVSPYLHWKVSIDPAKLQAAYPQIGTLLTVQVVQREGATPPGTPEWGGWVQKVRLTGTNGVVGTTVDISGDDFRRLYGLRSAYFTLDLVP